MYNLFNAIMTGVIAFTGVASASELPEGPMSVDKPYTVDQPFTVAQPYTSAKHVIVTAYTSEPRQTDATPCISADGSDICQRYQAGELICAAGDRNIPLGSKLYVEGYGECSVADRMNIRYNGTGRVDIYLGYDTPAAYRWGARYVAVQKVIGS